MGNGLTLRDIENAREALGGVIHDTPLDKSSTFSSIAGCEVYLKLENLQKTGSFKIRGAYNKIHSLSPEEKARGVIAASAGNHAQGVAYGASRAGIPATIVMPEAAPLAKVMATRGYGAEVVLAGGVYDEAYNRARELQREKGQTFVHAFDDLAVMAGQGTIGLEILDDLEAVSAIVAPVGGGGLIAGIAAAVKEKAPHVKVYGVQAEGAPAMYMSKRGHALKTTAEAITIADGIAVKVPGEQTFKLVEKYVDDIVVVDDEAIANSILMLLERAKLLVEGAGATSLAAVLAGKIPFPGKNGKIVSVVSGGNVDVNFISRIIERGLVKAGRHVRLYTQVLDRPGALNRLLAVVAQQQANVLNVVHDRAARRVPLGQAAVELSLETRDSGHTEQILTILRQEGYQVEVL